MAAEDIGSRIREARSARGVSLRSFAQAIGVSPSLVSQVENGRTQPSVSTLYAVVNYLGISFDQLLGAAEEAMPPGTTTATHPPVQRGSDNPVLEMENGVRWERLATGEDGPSDALLVTYEPGASSSVEGRLMRHAGVEYAYLIEGELHLQIDFDTYVLRAGDSTHFDSVRPHLYTNRGSTPARGVWFVVGRRQQNAAMPSADNGAGAQGTPAPLSSAVDVLRAMDSL